MKRARNDRPSVLPTWAKVEPKVLRALSKVDGRRSALTIAGYWLSVVVVSAICWRFWHPALYLLTLAFIGARHHDLLVLMHDAAHFRLFKNRKRNDWLSELLLTWPFFFVSTHAYRRNHHAHHKWVNTDQDPDLVGKTGPHWTFPMSGWRMAWIALTDVMGLAQLRILAIVRRLSAADAVPRKYKIGRAVFWLVAAPVIWLTGTWELFLLFHVVPFLTFTPMFLRFRAIAEHYGIREDLPIGTRSRTTLPTLLERVFFLSQPVWFHAEHHFHPSVPLHRLNELHAHLMARPEYAARVHISHGYLSAFKECTQRG